MTPPGNRARQRRRRRTVRRNDVHLIRRARRALRRRIEASQALDRVADELDANRLGIGGGKHVDDAAADAKAPCSSTGSSREKPASTSRSANRCGSISVPARSSTEARSRRSCELTRGNSAAPTQRSIGRSQPPQRGALGRAAAATRKCGVMPRGIDLNGRKRKHRLLDRRRDAPSSAHRRTARRRSSARRPDRSGRRAASAT